MARPVIAVKKLLVKKTVRRKNYTPSTPIDISLRTTKDHLQEVYNDLRWQVSFVSADNQQVNAWARCKDYLNDIVYAEVKKTPVSIYGMSYKPGQEAPVDLSRCRVVVRDPSIPKDKQETFYHQCKKALKLLHKMEASLKFKKTVLYKAKTSDDTLCYCVFDSDKEWLMATPLLSLYGLSLRVGRFYEGKSALEFFSSYIQSGSGNDTGYIRNAVESGYLKFLIKERLGAFGSTMEENYNFETVSYAHNLGISTVGHYIRQNAINGIPKNIRDCWKFPGVKPLTQTAKVG